MLIQDFTSLTFVLGFLAVLCLIDVAFALGFDYHKHAKIVGAIGVLCLLGTVGSCVAGAFSRQDVVRTTIEYTYIDGSKGRASYITLEGDNAPRLSNGRGSCKIGIPYHGYVLNVIKYRICNVDTIEKGIKAGDFYDKYYKKGGKR